MGEVKNTTENSNDNEHSSKKNIEHEDTKEEVNSNRDSLENTHELGLYPYEGKDVIKSITDLVHRLEKTNPEAFQGKKFPKVSKCSQCPDFDICLKIQDDNRCFRRTLDHQPCPELCNPDKVAKYNQHRAEELERQRYAIKKLVEERLIPMITDCENCPKNSICIPSKIKGNNITEEYCIHRRFILDYDNPCKQLCLDGNVTDEECRILGNECVLTKDKKSKNTMNRITNSTQSNDKEHLPASNKSKDIKLKVPDCKECYDKDLSCIWLVNDSISCIDEDMVEQEECLDVCPRAMNLTKSCQVL